MTSRQWNEPLEEKVLCRRAEAPPHRRDSQMAAWFEHPMRFIQCRTGVGEVRERISHGHEVEGGRAEDKALGRHSHELFVGTFPSASDGEHLFREVDADHRAWP